MIDFTLDIDSMGENLEPGLPSVRVQRRIITACHKLDVGNIYIINFDVQPYSTFAPSLRC